MSRLGNGAAVADNVCIAWNRRAADMPTLRATAPAPLESARSGQCVCLVSTGFIANRAQLAASARTDESAADASLLENQFDRFGLAAADRICGPFAWVVWDPAAGRMIACRDRTGVRNLYYAVSGDLFFIAPRIESILEQLPERPTWNLHALVGHLHGKAPPSGETHHKGVLEVRRGEILEITRNHLVGHRYWRARRWRILKLDDDAYAEAFREVMCEVVGQYLPASCFGLTVSSGLDSNSIAATLHRLGQLGRARAYVWSTPELADSQEEPLASGVCARLGIEQTTLQADRHWPLSNPQGIKTSLATPLWNYYTELWEATFALVARESKPVLFTGTSGDHLFGGSMNSLPDLLLAGRWDLLAQDLRKRSLADGRRRADLIVRQILRPLAKTLLPRWRPVHRRVAPWLKRELWGVYRRHYPPSRRERLLPPGRNTRLKHLQDPFLPSVIALLDRQAATHGIDLRHPLLDHRLFEFAGSLPAWQTHRTGESKILVRRAMRDRLPQEIVTLPGKIVPQALSRRGLAERETEKVWALMREMRCADLGLVDDRALISAYRSYLSGKTDTLFWYALTLEDWLQRHF